MKSADVVIGEDYVFSRWANATPTRVRVTGPAQRRTVRCGIGGEKSVLGFPVDSGGALQGQFVEARLLREPWSAYERRTREERERDARVEAARDARRDAWGDMPARLIDLRGVALVRLTADAAELVIHVADPDTAQRILDALSEAPTRASGAEPSGNPGELPTTIERTT